MSVLPYGNLAANKSRTREQKGATKMIASNRGKTPGDELSEAARKKVSGTFFFVPSSLLSRIAVEKGS